MTPCPVTCFVCSCCSGICPCRTRLPVAPSFLWCAALPLRLCHACVALQRSLPSQELPPRPRSEQGFRGGFKMTLGPFPLQGLLSSQVSPAAVRSQGSHRREKPVGTEAAGVSNVPSVAIREGWTDGGGWLAHQGEDGLQLCESRNTWVLPDAPPSHPGSPSEAIVALHAHSPMWWKPFLQHPILRPPAPGSGCVQSWHGCEELVFGLNMCGRNPFSS